MSVHHQIRTLTCAPEIEVIGQTVISFADNLNALEIEPILEQQGLLPIQPDVWYPAQNYLNVLNKLTLMGNTASDYVAIGMSVVQKMLVPPEMENLPLDAILMGWNDLYQMQHRGGDIGKVETVKLGEKHYRTIHRHLYPDDMTYGIAFGLAKRWLPRGTHFTVKYSDQEKRLDQGGERTIIDIQWD